MAQHRFRMPNADTSVVWAAAKAGLDAWRVAGPVPGDTGTHIEPVEGTHHATAQFRFQVDADTCLKVAPVWCRHGEQRGAVRFPYNLPPFTVPQVYEVAYPDPKCTTRMPLGITAYSGPDALEVFERTLFFTAPDAGRVGVLDLDTERVIDMVELGGFLSDLALDAKSGRLFVADGAGERIIVLDARTRGVLAEVHVPGFPRSIVLHGGRLVVACMAARCITVLDTRKLKVVKRIPLPLAPQHVEVRDGQILAWTLPGAYDPENFAEFAPDRLCYYPVHPFPRGPVRPPLPWQSLRAFKPGQLAPLVPKILNYEEFHVQPASAMVGPGVTPDTLTLRWLGPEARDETVSIAALLQRDGGGGSLPPELPDDAAPDRYVVAADTLFFTCPAAGKVGVIPLQQGAARPTLNLGGYLTDMVTFNGDVIERYVDRNLSFFPSPEAGRHDWPDASLPPPKVYVTDGVGNRVVVIDAASKRVTKELPVGGMPVALSLHGLELYVTCRKGREIVVIDVRTDDVVRRHRLNAEPLHAEVIKIQPPYTASEFRPPPAADEAPARLVVHFNPMASDLGTGAPADGPLVEQTDAALAETLYYRRRTEVSARLDRRTAGQSRKGTPESLSESRLQAAVAGELKRADPRPLAEASLQLPPEGRDSDRGDPRPNRGSSTAGRVGGLARRIFADNAHTLRLDGNRWLDVSDVTDRQRVCAAAARAGAPRCSQLGPKDTPGSITLSLDNGRESDWRRDTWITPETRQFLVADSDEFLAENAPVFDLAPGEHVLRVTARSPHARLCGLRVWRSLESVLSASAIPEPADVHGQVTLPTYQGVFAAGESVRFTLRVANAGRTRQSLSVTWRVSHPVDDECLAEATRRFNVPTGGEATLALQPKVSASGLLRLDVRLSSASGSLALSRNFLRLPKLEHPRLFCRADELPMIRARIGCYPELFRRYREWMEFKYHGSAFLPDDYRTTGHNTPMDLAKWRAICLMFMDWAMPAPDQRRPFFNRLRKDLVGTASGGWSCFQADFEFGAALAILYDLACGIEPEMKSVLRQQLGMSLRQGRALPEALAQIEEPLDAEARTVLGWHAVELANYIRYFRAHAGTLGGMLWQGLRSDCQCSLHSMARTFIVWSNFLADRKLVDAHFWSGSYTHHNYAMPRYDHPQFLSPGGVRGGGEHPPIGNKPVRLAITNLCRHPLEKTRNDLEPIITRLNGPFGYDEDRSARSTLSTETNVVVPLFLALGWYDPDRPAVDWPELPPSLLFDVEGAACLKSDWSPDMTDIYFVSGVRDVSYRTQPNHLQIYKAGRVLFGTGVHTHDHGTPTPSWANAVAIGEGTPHDWETATGYQRMNERHVIRRFPRESLGYITRDARCGGMTPQSGSWFTGGHAGPGMYDMVLHSHTWHPFVEQGRVVAFESSPEFDYVAGDATNVWGLEQAREVFRQLVFVRPDVLVVFDRLVLGPRQPPTCWVASTAPDLTVRGRTFRVANADAWLHGTVLLPESATLNVEGTRRVGLRQEGGELDQNLLRIAPCEHRNTAQYLTVLQTGTGKCAPLAVERIDGRDSAGVRFTYRGAEHTICFRREGALGGEVTIRQRGKKTVRRDLAASVDMSLRHWQRDPRYKPWMSEERFRWFLAPEACAQSPQKGRGRAGR
ncbi:MAG: hypothetical protein A3K19_22085 [Lentisphaerae bacterium RIFOXYB12_FULL_65_16]|nr:MAG: hypothetical protein A3K18_24555 [Lentisphaerae bacterium RIFOXYA12_64_32]OGV93551.1 MAG: hypothetical protein A3K19_22085 [Lentisphaerae bacterium RIFOXYB12_FULL_65_16]